MRILMSALMIAAAGLALPALASNSPAAAATDYLAKQKAKEQEQAAAKFTTQQREIILRYEREMQSAAAAPAAPTTGGKGHKGKSKDKGLPPGIAKNLERGKPLPPGIAKKGLPQDLVAKLPPAPKGHEIVVVDGRVLLVEVATQVIRDRIEDLVFHH